MHSCCLVYNSEMNSVGYFVVIYLGSQGYG